MPASKSPELAPLDPLAPLLLLVPLDPLEPLDALEFPLSPGTFESELPHATAQPIATPRNAHGTKRILMRAPS
jgi:hypothetical protein